MYFVKLTILSLKFGRIAISFSNLRFLPLDANAKEEKLATTAAEDETVTTATTTTDIYTS